MSIKTIEKFDADKLNYIINNLDTLVDQSLWKPEDYQSYKTRLSNYLTQSRGGQISVEYRQRHGEGRFSARGGLSLQFISREVRHTISSSIYRDIDMVNAHPVILKHICDKADIPTSNLSIYINKRDILIKNITNKFPGISRDFIKTAFLSAINGGKKDITTLLTQLSESQDATIKKIYIFIKRFESEINNIQTALLSKNPDKFAIFNKQYNIDRKSGSLLGSFTNTFLCDFENKILQVIYKQLFPESGPHDCVLCFDGIMIPQNMPFNLNELEKAVLNECGIVIKLLEKPMNNTYNIPADIQPYVYKSYNLFSNYKEFIGKVLDRDVIDEWVKNTFVIVNGVGKELFYIRDKKEDALNIFTINYTPNKPLEVYATLKVRCHIINPLFDESYYEEHKDKRDSHWSRKNVKFNRYSHNTISDYLQYSKEEGLIPCYNYVDCVPYKGDTPPNLYETFNLFTGFPLTNCKSNKKFEDSKMYNHIKNTLCSGDKGEFNHLLDHIADILQDPASVKPNAHLFYSVQGVGKDIFGTWMSSVIGSKYVCKINNVDRFFTSSFNAHTAGKLLKIVNELSDKGTAYQLHNQLKSLIDMESEQVEKKGHDAYYIRNYSRYWFFTNNENSLMIEPSDRRFTLHRCDNSNACDNAYFKPIIEEINDIEFIKAAFIFFNNREYEIKNARSAYLTKYKHEQKMQCLSQSIKWLLEFIPDNFERNQIINTSDTEDTYSIRFPLKTIVNESGIKINTLKSQLGAIGIIPKRCKYNASSMRVMCYELNPADVREAIRTYLKNPDFEFDYGCDDPENIGDSDSNDMDFDDMDIDLSEFL